MKKGFLFSANQNGCIFKKGDTVKLRGKRTTKGLFVLDMQVCLPEIVAQVHIASSKENLQLWHERLCHQNKKHVQKVLKRKRIEIQSEEDFCDGCVLGKHQRKSVGTRMNRPVTPGALIHADVCGVCVLGKHQRKSVGTRMNRPVTPGALIHADDGYRICIEAEGSVIRSRDVVFKKEMPLKEKLQLLSKKQKHVDPTSQQTEKVAVNDEPLKEGEIDIEVTTSEEAVAEDGIPSSSAKLEMDVKRQQRDTKKPAYLRDYVYLAECDAPDSYAMKTNGAESVQISKLICGSVFIDQKAYTQKVLDRFNMGDANSVTTPAECSAHNIDDSVEPAQGIPHREAVGSLMYLTIATRPDIAYAVSRVSETLENPTISNWKAVKRIFRYLKGSIEFGILYEKESNDKLEAFSDADYAGDLDTRRSRSGIVWKFKN
ncbi:GAG-pre-integrase domain, partial [Popillia japonica]